jgi:glucose/arabinose dehydrogenase
MRRRLDAGVVVAGALAVVVTGILSAQKNDHAGVLKGAAAFGDWRKDKPGVRRLMTPRDLPPPNATPSATGFAQTVPIPPGARPSVPAGFAVEMVASGLKGPRVVRVAPNGDIFVTESNANTVRALRMAAGSAKLSGTGAPNAAASLGSNEVFLSGLSQPYGIAFYPPGPDPKWVYVANSDSLVRVPYANGDLKASGKPERIVERIPWQHHWSRDVAVSPDGKRIFYSVGSGSNVALDMFPIPLDMPFEEFKKTRPLGATWDTEDRRADVLSFDPDGKNEKIFATGLRNCAGVTIQPATGHLWCVVNERDLLGDDTPFEYATDVQEGAFYGWPWYYIGGHQDPRHKGARPDLKDHVTIPAVLMQAHSAPLQIAFYEADAFPAGYKGSAFVTLHGSWNRRQRTGYKVVRLLFQNGKATGEYEDFMTGFVVSDTQVWGRPVGVAVAKDGSLIVSEDGAGTLWRVTSQGAK